MFFVLEFILIVLIIQYYYFFVVGFCDEDFIIVFVFFEEGFNFGFEFFSMFNIINEVIEGWFLVCLVGVVGFFEYQFDFFVYDVIVVDVFLVIVLEFVEEVVELVQIFFEGFDVFFNESWKDFYEDYF